MTRKPSHVWIVEVLWATANTWQPTVGIAFRREEARLELWRWRKSNPDDKFRLRRYDAGAEKGNK